jgi:hypothetical protein
VSNNQNVGHGDGAILAAAVQAAEELRVWEKQCKDWCTLIKTTHGKLFFKYMQFISSDKKEEAGSEWCRLVCNDLNVPVARQEEFWDRPINGGKSTARLAINRRRMNMTNAMKGVFQGKWVGAVCFGLVCL